MSSLLPAFLVILSLAILISLALFFSLRHRIRSRVPITASSSSPSSSFNTHSPSPSHNSKTTISSLLHAADTPSTLQPRPQQHLQQQRQHQQEKYICKPPGQTYKLHVPHTSLAAQRKRVPLPKEKGRRRKKKKEEGWSPTHSGAEWGNLVEVVEVESESEKDIGGRGEKMKVGKGLRREGDGNFEVVFLGGKGGEMVEIGRARGEGEAESLWGKRARMVVERRMGAVEEEERDGCNGVGKMGSVSRVEKSREEKTLGAFDFEREEAGRKLGRQGGERGFLSGWRVILFGRGEYAG